MGKDNRSTVQELARWLRIGTLTLTTLGPVIDALITRLRERRVETRHEPASVSANADLQERLVVVGGALKDLVAELKNNPYAQDLRKRGEAVAEELVARGNRLSQAVVERGSGLTQELAGRGERATRELSRRSQQARRELVERSNPLVLIAGFSVGLLAAIAAMYLFIRKRLQQSNLDEEPHIELPSNGRVRGSVIEARFGHIVQPTIAEEASPTAEDLAASTVAANNQAPFDAVLVGVVDTGRYYPIDTPLDQLHASTDEAADVVYFTSEEEARSQGFIPAN